MRTNRFIVPICLVLIPCLWGCQEASNWGLIPDADLNHEDPLDSDVTDAGVDRDLEDADPEDADGVTTDPEDADVQDTHTVDTDPEECNPRTCSDVGATCGTIDDGCGATIGCGSCDDDGEECQDNRCVPPPVDCSGIEAHPGYELCDSDDNSCAGVFTNYDGCHEYCAAAGLVCRARYGGSEGCGFEAHVPLHCDDSNGHESDWCECERGDVVVDPDPTCPSEPGDPPRRFEIGFLDGSYYNRSAWVLLCRDYAYTAFQDEHESCDSEYAHGSGQGSVTFTFSDVPRGSYDVYIEGRHTTSRNHHGALVVVTCGTESYTENIDQHDDSMAIIQDFHGRYCLDGRVEILMDSTVSTASDSVSAVILEPAG